HNGHQEEPLLTAAERVEHALARVTAGKQLTEEQDIWLGRIRAHLVANLSIGREDFTDVPVLERGGGGRRVRPLVVHWSVGSSKLTRRGRHERYRPKTLGLLPYASP